MLFDASLGRGIATRTWPPPPADELKFGYAGGLGPHNLAEQYGLMAQAAEGQTLWVDMESGIRSVSISY